VMEARFLEKVTLMEYLKKGTCNRMLKQQERDFFMPRKRSIVLFLVLCLWLLPALSACDGDIAANPLGYSFVGKTMQESDQKKTVSVSPPHTKPLPHLRPYGVGLPPEAFVTQYGQPLVPSQPPTQLWFKATLDTFPTGSVMIVGFDRSSVDSAPRAN